MRGKRWSLCLAVAAALLAACGFAATLEENKEQSPELRVPDGFQAAAGTTAEPYTDTGWAAQVIHIETRIEMVFIPAGEFEMGTPPDEKHRHRVDEGPLHTVVITKPFYLGKYEVTQQEWQKVMGSHPHPYRGDRVPADQVSWNACQEFLEKTGLRLPTEAEWEYSCRAGTSTAFCFGDDYADLDKYCLSHKSSSGKPHAVGSKLPNAWGLYDMHGNVWEWCSDWYDADYYETSPKEDPQGPSSGSVHMLRGGSWYEGGRICRSGNRRPDAPEVANVGMGFRPAHTIK